MVESSIEETRMEETSVKETRLEEASVGGGGYRSLETSVEDTSVEEMQGLWSEGVV